MATRAPNWPRAERITSGRAVYASNMAPEMTARPNVMVIWTDASHLGVSKSEGPDTYATSAGE